MRLVLKRLWGTLPEHLKLGRTYRQTRKFLDATRTWTATDWDEHRLSQLRATLTHAGTDVPYYADLFARLKFVPQELTDFSQFASLPLVDKAAMIAAPNQFTSQRLKQSDYMELSTGGSTGVPHTFPYPRKNYNREYAFMFDLWSRAGFRPGERLVILRGQPLPDETLYEFDPRWNARVFSAQHVVPGKLRAYVDAMNEFDARYLLAYPSAVVWLFRLLDEAGLRPPRFKNLLLGSEGISERDRTFLLEFGQMSPFAWYGHTERLVLAGECEYSGLYHEEPAYGYMELVDQAGRVISQPGELGEIVGTTFDNPAFPFIRFKTGDWAEWAHQECACSRPHKRFTNVNGRMHSEHLVGKDGSFFSPTALNRHGDEYKHIHKFQYVQTRAGDVTVRIVPSASFTASDSDHLLMRLHTVSGSRINWSSEIVDRIDPGPGGKHRIVDRQIPAAAAFMEPAN